MAGEAKSGKFMLGTCTVMIGPQQDWRALGTQHSVGLVKNISLKTTPGFTELTQGVKNSLVASVQTKNDMMVDGEMYEYTAKNLTYAAALDGNAVSTTPLSNTVASLVAAPAAGGAGEPLALGAAAVPITLATGFAPGDSVFIQISADQIFARKISSIATNTLTLNAGLPVAIPIGAIVTKVTMVPLGSTKDTPYFSAKLVGQIADGSWVTVMLPKVRLVSGLSMAFKTDNFDNMPLQLTVYDLVATDAGYADFTDAQGFTSKAQIYVTN